MFPKNHLGALVFITDFFRKNNIPYVLTGGGAARVYGSPREVVDLDFDVPNEYLQPIADSLREYVTSGPKKHQGEGFNVTLLELEYNGTPIDIGGAKDFEIFDKQSNRWVPDVTDFTHFKEIDIGGNKIKVVSLSDLLVYKRKLLRDVDVKDV